MPVALDDYADRQRLIEVLAALPEIEDASARGGFVTAAFAGYPRAQRQRAILRLDGAAAVFAHRLIDEAIRFGQVEWGREALAVLLSHVRRQVGVADGLFLDNLMWRAGLGGEAPQSPPAQTDGQLQGGPDDLNLGAQVNESIVGEDTLLSVHLLARALRAARAIAMLVVDASGDAAARGLPNCGTGFLVGEDLLLTCHHVIATPEEARTAEARFRYEFDIDGRADDGAMVRATILPDAGFYTRPDLDLTIVRVSGAPADARPVPLLDRSALKGARAPIIQHPNGGPKQVSLNHNIVLASDGLRVRYTTTTQRGSSGSPVFDARFEGVVALHTSGVPLDASTLPGVGRLPIWSNSGTASTAILADLAANAPALRAQLASLAPSGAAVGQANAMPLGSALEQRIVDALWERVEPDPDGRKGSISSALGAGHPALRVVDFAVPGAEPYVRRLSQTLITDGLRDPAGAPALWRVAHFYLARLGVDHAAASEALRAPIEAAMPRPADARLVRDGLAADLAALYDASVADAPLVVTQAMVDAARVHIPGTLDERRLQRITAWSTAAEHLDQRFVELKLRRPGQRSEAEEQRGGFEDLRFALRDIDERTLLVLGRPGAGKSTLLGRLELDLSRDGLRGDPRVVFHVSLKDHRAPDGASDDQVPTPFEWLAARWQRQWPQLPTLEDLLGMRRLVLLLDGLNELPRRDADDLTLRLSAWSRFLRDHFGRDTANRAIVTCRDQDEYSALFGGEEASVASLTVQPLDDDRVRAFLGAHLVAPDTPATVWAKIRDTRQLSDGSGDGVLRTPFYLKLLCDEVNDTGRILDRPAPLITAFVRRALEREAVTRANPVVVAGLATGDVALLTRARAQRSGFTWPAPVATSLPAAGPLVHDLAALAYGMQAARGGERSTGVGAAWAEVAAILGDHADQMVAAGKALGLLVQDAEGTPVAFSHQLFQEHFAARVLAARPDAAELTNRVAQPWRAGELQPSMADVDQRPHGEPLPPPPATGWDETAVQAVALLDDAAAADLWVGAIAGVNLPLAARCAVEARMDLGGARKTEIRSRLLDRMRDESADVRARIRAGLALGESIDPRLSRHEGTHGVYLLPPFVAVPGGDYEIGSKDSEPHYAQELPLHPTPLPDFQIAAFPVTNAEYRLFIASGGYDDERWWQPKAAWEWRQGTLDDEPWRERWRANRRWYQEQAAEWKDRAAREPSFAVLVADPLRQAAMADEEFEQVVADVYAPLERRQPRFLDTAGRNAAAQPVVGVSWFEARAYCAWLAAQTGTPMRLPREPEWEAAARGRERRAFPWGDDWNEDADPYRCNTVHSRILASTPVGMFPRAATPNGIHDLAGNVWEWTSTQFEDRYRADGTEDALELTDDVYVARVVRGGSWLDSRDLARAASRSGNDPGARGDSLGFRVVLGASSPIS